MQAGAAREARRGAAAQISELESRAAADKANLERCGSASAFLSPWSCCCNEAECYVLQLLAGNELHASIATALVCVVLRVNTAFESKQVLLLAPCRVWALRLEEAERMWSDRLSSAVATASSKVEEFKQRQSLEAAKAAEAAALNAAEAESRCASVLPLRAGSGRCANCLLHSTCCGLQVPNARADVVAIVHLTHKHPCCRCCCCCCCCCCRQVAQAA
jgi:hypothetical protein